MHHAAAVFDLDGTLSDPSEGMRASYLSAFAALGEPVPPGFEIRPLVGPALERVFREHFRWPPALAQRGVDAYRAHYNTEGWHMNALYPEVPALLQRLRARGVALAVATNKPQATARRIVAHFGLCIDEAMVFGALPGIEANKAEILRRALAYASPVTSTQASDAARRVMIGDRSMDVTAAHAVGVHSVGVLYGFGAVTEIVGARPTLVVDTPRTLSRALERLLLD